MNAPGMKPPPRSLRSLPPGARVSALGPPGATDMKDAPRLSGFTACNPAEPPTGGRASRFGAAVRGGPSIFHASRVALSAMDN